jgi:DNA (cytosine-5)-methyltransferase 1
MHLESNALTRNSMSLASAVHYFSTPTARDWKGHTITAAHPNGFNRSLANDVKMFPTPNASDSRNRGNMSNPAIQRRAAIGKQLNLSMVVDPTSGQLNPPFVEWLMGFPIGFTASKDWVTPKSRCKPQPPIDCLGESEGETKGIPSV